MDPDPTLVRLLCDDIRLTKCFNVYTVIFEEKNLSHAKHFSFILMMKNLNRDPY